MDRDGKGGYRLYIFVIVSLGTAALLWAVQELDDFVLAGFLVGSAAISDIFGARVRSGVATSLTAVVILTGLLLGGPSAAVVACIGASAYSLLKADNRRFVRAAFNFSQEAIAALSAGLLYQAASGTADVVADIVQPRNLVSFAFAVVVHTAVNHGLVTGVVSLDSGEPYFRVFRGGLLPALLQTAYSPLAVFAAILVLDVSPQSLLLLIIPALVARAGLMAFQRVDEAYERLVRSFAKTIEAKDEYTKGHSERVSYLSDLVAGDLRIGYHDRRLVRYAAMLHDVGKIGVPLCVINKPGPLDDAEFHQMQAHPIIGENILRDIDFLLPVLDVVRHHHERLDGRGYPDGLTAEDLSEAVRIVTAVDAFDAMTSTRAYRRSMSVEEAMAEMHRCSGSQFDRRIVAALQAVVERIGWKPTMAWKGDIAEIPNVTHVPPLTERHDFRIGDGGMATEVGS